MLARSFAAIAAVCLCGTAMAQEGGPPAAAAPAKEKKICRSVVPTGTIMSKRICLTKAEWARFNEQNERHADMLKDSRNRAVDTRALGF